MFYDNRAITAQVDVDFDIGPSYYNFIDVRYIGEPVLRERIFAADQNVTYITRTVNVTNITYRDNHVYSYGPDYNTLNRYSTRPIQRLSVQRETSVDPVAAVRSRSLMKVQGDRLVIAAPQTLQRPDTSEAPKSVKEKIAQAPVERGWEGLSDQKAQTELKQKMKAEDSKTVPPPTVQAVRQETAPSPAASAPATSAASATPPSNASPTPTAATSPAASKSVSPYKDQDKAKEKAKRNEKDSPKATPATTPDSSAAPAITPDARDQGKDRKREKVAPSASIPPSTGVTETVPPRPSDTEKAEKRKPKEKPPVPPADAAEKSALPPIPPRPVVQPQPDRKRDRLEPVKPDAAPQAPPQETAVGPSSKPPKNQGPKTEQAAPGPAADAPGNPPAREEGKKKKKDEPAPAPTP